MIHPKTHDIHTVDSLCCTVETNTTLYSNRTPIKINLKKKQGQPTLTGCESPNASERREVIYNSNKHFLKNVFPL